MTSRKRISPAPPSAPCSRRPSTMSPAPKRSPIEQRPHVLAAAERVLGDHGAGWHRSRRPPGPRDGRGNPRSSVARTCRCRSGKRPGCPRGPGSRRRWPAAARSSRRPRAPPAPAPGRWRCAACGPRSPGRLAASGGQFGAAEVRRHRAITAAPGIDPDQQAGPAPETVTTRGAAAAREARDPAVLDLLQPARCGQLVAQPENGGPGEARGLHRLGGSEVLGDDGMAQQRLDVHPASTLVDTRIDTSSACVLDVDSYVGS